MKPPVLGALAAGAVFAIDQTSKTWLIHGFDLGGRAAIPLLPFLDLVMAWNKGISYSLFRSDDALGRWLLLAFAMAALGFLIAWLVRAQSALTALALGLVIGGALGNACDRLFYGAVADFLYFHTPVSLGPLSNYVFNLADVGIVAGVAGLLYESLFPGAGAKAALGDVN